MGMKPTHVQGMLKKNINFNCIYKDGNEQLMKHDL